MKGKRDRQGIHVSEVLMFRTYASLKKKNPSDLVYFELFLFQLNARFAKILLTQIYLMLNYAKLSLSEQFVLERFKATEKDTARYV